MIGSKGKAHKMPAKEGIYFTKMFCEVYQEANLWDINLPDYMYHTGQCVHVGLPVAT